VEKGYGLVQLETDSKVLVDKLTSVSQPEAFMKAIIWDIHHLKQQLSSIKFLFTPRSYNGAVYLVASHATRLGGYHMWDFLEPKWLFNALAFDVNISIRL